MISFRMKFNIATAALSTVLVLSALPLRPATAQQLPPLPLEFNPENLINPGRPGGRRRGGGSRGSCQADIPLTAVAYANSRTVQELGVSRNDEAVGMVTTLQTPDLWFYMPAAVGNNATEFVLKNASEQVIYQGQLAGTTNDSGIIGVTLPVALNVNDAYHWYLTVDCDDSERVTVNGWVERRAIGPDIDRTLRQANERNRAALAANFGFLQDAVSNLAVSRQIDPDSKTATQDWEQLMTVLGLPELSAVAVHLCCELSNEPVNGPTETTPPTESTPPEAEEMPDPAPVEPEEESRSILQRARDRGN
ncbi:MAG: DUF928 domain-containing protein [Cyanobacteria bacterium J06634_6]